MEEVSTNQYNDNGRVAGGICALMKKFPTYRGLKLSHIIFSITEKLPRTSQYKDLTAQEALKSIKPSLAYFCKLSLRIDEKHFGKKHSEKLLKKAIK